MATTTTFIASGFTTVGVNVLNLSAYNQSSGNCIVVGFAFYSPSAGAPTISDTAGNTYVKAIGPLGSSGTGNNFYIYLYYAKNCLGNAANVIAMTFPSDSNIGYDSAFAWDIAGADPNGPLDEIGFNDSSQAASGTPISDLLTTSQTDAAVILFTTSVNGLNTYTTPLIDGTSPTFDGHTGYTGDTTSGAHVDWSGSRLTNTKGHFSGSTATPYISILASFVPAPTPSGNLVQQKWQELGTKPAQVQKMPITITSGNFVAVIAMPGNAGHATVSSMVDDLGNTYHQAPSSAVFNSSVFSGTEIEIWYAMNVTGGVGTITVTYSLGSGYGFNFLQVAEYTGIALTGALDTSNNNTGNSAAPSVNLTLASSSELVIGVCLTNTGNPSWSTLTDEAAGVAAGAGMLYGDATPGSSGSFSVAGTVTSTNWVISSAAFYIGSPPPPASGGGFICFVVTA